MNTYKMIVSYDGTDFQGWQIQPNRPTITSCLQERFAKVFGATPSILGASRTDAGVHALGQVARVRLPEHLASPQLLDAWNNALPSSILIRDLQQVNESFNPFAHVKQKTYYYHLFYKRPLPFIARYGWLYKFIDRVDMNELERTIQIYKGEHDFGSFCKQENEHEKTVRTIDDIYMKHLPRFGAVRIVVRGKGFLRFQIRRMIGYALDVVRRNELTTDYLRELLRNPNPRQTLVKAAASGLVLRNVEYNPSSSLRLASAPKDATGAATPCPS